jgi:pimeloyl-ACP methyl ester carboxylesterase
MTSQILITAPAPARRRAVWRPSQIGAGDEAIAVFEAGLHDAAAPVLVLVHGMGHWTQAAWDFFAAEFESTHRVVAFDLPGFGASAKPDVPYTLASFTRSLRHVVETSGISQFALAGHSLGGLIAANYAATYPAEVRHLTLIGPAGFLRTPKLALRVAGSRPVTWLFRRIRPGQRFVRRTLERAVFDPSGVPEDYYERACALSKDPAMTRAFVRVYAGAMHELLHMRALHARLAAYRGAALLAWGSEDAFVPVRGLESARRVYPQADVLKIERCGHCPSLEYPELLAARARSGGA